VGPDTDITVSVTPFEGRNTNTTSKKRNPIDTAASRDRGSTGRVITTASIAKDGAVKGLHAHKTSCRQRAIAQ
jgi:hypothetical protein